MGHTKKRGGGVLGDAVALGDGCLGHYADLGEGNSVWSRELSGKLVVDWRYGFAGGVVLVVDYRQQTLASARMRRCMRASSQFTTTIRDEPSRVLSCEGDDISTVPDMAGEGRSLRMLGVGLQMDVQQAVGARF